MAILDEEEKKLQIEQKKMDILLKQIEATERLHHAELEPDEKRVVIAMLRPQIELLFATHVTLDVNEPRAG